MDELSALKSGRIMHLDEVQQEGAALRGASIRVMGRVRRYDVESGSVEIGHRGASLTVDVRHVAGTPVRQGSLFQFIGEMDVEPTSGDSQGILRARVARNVDGLDENLFDQALALRRHFERESHAHLMT